MKIILGLILLLAVVSLAGCSHDVVMVPACEYSKPPAADAYLKGNTDERLVLMTASFTDSMRKASTCNANIEKINTKNKALFQ